MSHTAPAEFEEPGSPLEARRSQSHTPRRVATRRSDDVVTMPCESQATHPPQSLGPPTGFVQQTLQDIENYEEQITLLPPQDRQPSSSETSQRRHDDDGHKTFSTHSVPLHRSGYIVLMVFLYASSALIAWALICVLAFKPINADYYGFDVRDLQHSSLKSKFPRNEEIYRAARIVQTVVTIVTIPLTSAVCSSAAVVFAQSKKGDRRLTLRQMMTLADKGWTDPKTIVKLIFGRGKQLGSSLFLFAVLLNLLGECC